MKAYVDTSAIMTSRVNGTDAEREAFTRGLRSALSGRERVVSPLVVAELFYSATTSKQNAHHWPPDKTHALVEEWSANHTAPVPPRCAKRAMELVREFASIPLGAYDALHLAIAEDENCSVVVAVDGKFPDAFRTADGSREISVQQVKPITASGYVMPRKVRQSRRSK